MQSHLFSLSAQNFPSSLQRELKTLGVENSRNTTFTKLPDRHHKTPWHLSGDHLKVDPLTMLSISGRAPEVLVSGVPVPISGAWRAPSSPAGVRPRQMALAGGRLPPNCPRPRRPRTSLPSGAGWEVLAENVLSRRYLGQISVTSGSANLRLLDSGRICVLVHTCERWGAEQCRLILVGGSVGAQFVVMQCAWRLPSWPFLKKLFYLID